MSIKTLLYIELNNIYSRINIKQHAILYLSIILPAFFMLNPMIQQYLSNSIDNTTKTFVASNFSNILLIRFSLSLYLFVSYMFISQAFYGRKISGEVESLISIGYSAKQIWLAKTIAVTIASILSTLPVIILIECGLFVYLYVSHHILLNISLTGILTVVIINPLISFCISLIAGGMQLVTDNYYKTSMTIFVMSFLNMFTISFSGKVTTQNNGLIYIYIVLSCISILIMLLYSLQLSKKIYNESLIIGTTDKVTKIKPAML